MTDEPIPFHRPFVAGRELEYVGEAVRRGKLSGDGEFTRRCHAWMAERFAARRVLLTTSCTTALEMAAILAEPAENAEVIIPGFTFVSTANAFVLHGFRPVFAEIRADTLNLDETKLEALITKDTRAIVPVHYAGVPCEMERILEIARAHDLLVIEDAAQAVGSIHRGRAAGTLGDLGAYSFHDTKNLTAGEGGALLVNRPELDHRAELIREKGTNRSQFVRGEVDKYTWVDVGGSYLPSEINAAFLLAQLEAIDEVERKRRALWLRYQEALRPLERSERFRLPVIPDGVASNHHIFFLVLRSLEERTRLIADLAAKRIQAVSHYVALHTSPFGRRYARGSLPIVEHTADAVLRLPLFPQLAARDQDRVIDAVLEFARVTS
jgi:dTDP-4-amino-4,6-dideoxygalactose transaminase